MYPFLVAAVSELDSVIQVVAQRGIATVLEGLSRGPTAGYSFKGYLSAEFPVETARIVPRFTEGTFRRLMAEAKRRTGK